MQHQILNIKSIKEEKIGEEIVFEELYISPDKTYISGVTSAFYQLMDGQAVRVENTQFGIANNFNISVENSKKQGWVDYMKKYNLYSVNIACDYESLVNVELSYIIYNGKYVYEDVSESLGVNGEKVYTPLSTFTLSNFGKITIDKTKKYVRVPTRYFIYDDKITIDDNDYFNGIDFDLKNHLNKGSDGMYSDYLYIDGISNIIKFYSSDSLPEVLKCSLVINEETSSKIDINNVYCAEPHRYTIVNNSEYEVQQISDSEGLKDYIDVITSLYYYKGLDGTILSFSSYTEASNSAKSANISTDLIFVKENKVREYAVINRNYPEYFYNNNIAINFDSEYAKIIDGSFNGDFSFFTNLKIITKYTSSDYGSKIFILYDNSITSEKGDEIDFLGKNDEKRIIDVRRYDTSGTNYVIIDGIVYDETPNTHYSIKINNFNYRVDIDDNSQAVLLVNGGTVNVLPHFNGNNILTSITQNIISGNNTIQQIYTNITPLGSYLIDNKVYDSKIYKKINGDLDGNALTLEYIAIEYNEKAKGKLVVDEVVGNNMLLCTPLTSIFNESINSESVAEEVCSLLYSNFIDIDFTFKNKIFGQFKRPEDFNLLRGYIEDKDFIHIYNLNSFIELPLQLDNDETVNLFQEENVNDYFTNEEEENIVNDSADNERDIYYPSEYVEGDNLCKLPINLKICSEMELNFHFRNRNSNGWDILKDNGPYDFKTTGCSSYMVFDNPMYSGITQEADYNKICNVSDLLCFLNFTDNDVFYQKEKIDKTFARLEFYDSPNPNNQSLLFYSTVFLDSGSIYKKYIYGMDDALNMYLTVNQFDLLNGEYKNISPEVRDSIRVNTELSSGDTVENDTKEIVSIIDEEKRLSCRINIKDKFNTVTSSDGFYLYMFKDYSTRFYERSIYLKVEFNHAGYGKTIPMSYPRKFYCNNNEITSLTLYSAEINGKEYELVNPYTVRLSDGKEYPIESQLEKSIGNIKKGYQIKNSYYQEYIEIKVIYDSVNKKYCYYLPFSDETCYNNGKMILNLFELKINNINGN